MTTIFQRTIKEKLEQELANNKIILLTGPRQAGKTTLLNQLATQLKSQGEQVFSYNFDRIADLDFFSKQQKVEAFLKLRSLRSRLYIFIDEVQRKSDAGNFFKYFYDIGLNVKFIFSGSSSIELTDSFGDALTGRKEMFGLLPLSFREIAATQQPEEFDFAIQGEPMALEKIYPTIEEQLIWGSYPEVVASATPEKKLRILSELYESYVQKDVKDLLKVKNIAGFNLLIKLLAHNISSPIVIEDLVRQTSLHQNTINSYLDILEGTMIIARLENYNPDFNEGMPKAKRFYFIDNGLRNYSLGMMQEGFRTDYNKLAANLLFAELLKAKQYETLGNLLGEDFRHGEIYHYQTYSDNYLDFVIQSNSSNKFLPIVVRFPEDSEVLGKKVHEFINNKHPEQLLIITNQLELETEIKGCLVKFIPLVELLAK